MAPLMWLNKEHGLQNPVNGEVTDASGRTNHCTHHQLTIPQTEQRFDWVSRTTPGGEKSSALIVGYPDNGGKVVVATALNVYTSPRRRWWKHLIGAADSQQTYRHFLDLQINLTSSGPKISDEPEIIARKILIPVTALRPEELNR